MTSKPGEFLDLFVHFLNLLSYFKNCFCIKYEYFIQSIHFLSAVVLSLFSMSSVFFFASPPYYTLFSHYDYSQEKKIEARKIIVTTGKTTGRTLRTLQLSNQLVGTLYSPGWYAITLKDTTVVFLSDEKQQAVWPCPWHLQIDAALVITLWHLHCSQLSNHWHFGSLTAPLEWHVTAIRAPSKVTCDIFPCH